MKNRLFYTLTALILVAGIYSSANAFSLTYYTKSNSYTCRCNDATAFNYSGGDVNGNPWTFGSASAKCDTDCQSHGGIAMVEQVNGCASSISDIVEINDDSFKNIEGLENFDVQEVIAPDGTTHTGKAGIEYLRKMGTR